ncbi:MAG: hypothetical protein PWQ57_2008 [Desulfovibrionales bacterium]|nr:hypothetical protein [Desulfovibrionales bacterium]
MSNFWKGYLDVDGQPNRAYHAARVSDRTVDELIGMAKGFVADGEISPGEADALVRWLKVNQALAPDDFVVKHLTKRIVTMLEDGVIDAEERKELFEILSELCGQDAAPGAAHSFSTTLPLDTPYPNICFAAATFCLTGKFACGTRTKCQQVVEKLGGVNHKVVRLDTNYLVIGSIGSRDWIHTSYGRKIEKAVNYKEKKGASIAIVCEEHWAEAVWTQTNKM